MKAFLMVREDGPIGEGVEFTNGQVVVQNAAGTLVVCPDRDSAILLHNADGQTQFQFTEEMISA